MSLATVAAPAARTAAGVVGVGWLIGTALSQHPHRSFDRLRQFDRSGLVIPNWRFFAPNPAIHDNRLAHRILWQDGSASEWIETHEIVGRTWHDGLWCPGRRRDKAVTDMCSNLLQLLSERHGDAVEHMPTYLTMNAVVRHQVGQHPEAEGRGIQGYQFAVCRDPGYDEEAELELIFASRFEAWQPEVGPGVRA